MKLIACYISGFGALRDQTVTFEKDLTQFFRSNGAGKSTLAAFLKAMLYGMPSYKANSKGFEDRRHYLPFDGGPYGGSLTLSYEGETYCITRRFDAKSEGKDSLVVTCQGAPTSALGKVPGRTIFQVDSDSFERTAFFTADPGELGATTGIAGRLQSFLDNAPAAHDFASAYSALEEAARSLQSSRGQNGKIARQQMLVRRLEQDLLSRNQLSDALEEKYAAREALEKQIADSQRSLEENQAVKLSQERWQRYQGLQADAQRKASKAQHLQSLCGDPRPTDGQRRALEDCRASIIESRAALNFDLFPEEKRRRLAALQSSYPKGIPAQEELDAAEKLQQALDNPPPPPEKPGNLGKTLLILGIVLALGGAVTAVFSLIAGIALLAVGIGLALCGWVLGSKAKKAYQAALHRQEARRSRLEEELQELLAPYGLNRYSSQLRSHGFYLEDLTKERLQAQERYQQLQSKLDSSASQAAAIFQSCGLTLSQDPEGDIQTLCNNLDALVPMLADARQAELAAEGYRRENNLFGQMPVLTADPAALSRELNTRRQQLAALEREIAEDEYRLEDLSDCHVQLEEAREQEGLLRRQYRLLTAARDCLADAEQSLKAKHIDPVRSRFDFYADALEDALGERVGLDKNFGLYLQEKGGQYSNLHWSAGQRAVVALCLRLALLDNLYPGDKPPIILDDPFVFLDGEHLEKAKGLVTSLSKQWQILYFTCHESRMICNTNS
ncbi:MAG: ATP-binding protein [Faecousia sp.]